MQEFTTTISYQAAMEFASTTLGVLAQAGAHAVAQGALSLMQGNNFGQAFIAGALGSLGASAFGAIAKGAASSAIGQITFEALAGGAGSALSGGNFWQGALIGGTVAGLNHAMHEIGNELTQKEPQQKKESWDLDGDGKMDLGEANNWYRKGKGAGCHLRCK
ncbi:MAG: hypothetical protein MUW56_09425 [Chryseobacterium sp.]|uniref:hypothetical protein n=1 Tax=Chryseobacterium sp. TaxID=1871047 RepID=UPI0025C4E142|nr:hypothetical protein [Chryseobacterium sp.]MCJ7933837.1 hypothetical protein [Chryseobacterium sp.]